MIAKPILVGYDPRRADRAPMEFGVWAARLTGAPLVVASVQRAVPRAPSVPVSAEPLEYAVGRPDHDLMSDCSPAIQQIEIELGALGIPVECLTLEGTSAARALHEAAEEREAGMLVVGSSRRSASGRVLAGTSTGARLLQGAPCAVAVVPRGWRESGRPATFGVAYVDSDDGREALRSAHALARHVGASLRVLTVVHDGSDAGERRVRAEKRLTAAVAALDGVPVEAEALIGDPAEVLIAVSEHLDLLVCGSRGYGPLRAVLLGSVSRRVMDAAQCPVIVLPRGVRAPLEAILATSPAPRAVAR